MLFFLLCGFKYLNAQSFTLLLANQVQYNSSSKQFFIEPNDFCFLDTFQNKLYYSIATNTNYSEEINIEIKKKSNQQFKLQPYFSKTIQLQSTYFLDSINLNEIINTGNFDLIIYNTKTKVELAKKTFQTIRVKNNLVTATPNKPAYELIKIQTTNEVDISKTFVYKYTLAQLLKNCKALKPIANGAELNTILGLTESSSLDNVQHFFYNFWDNRNHNNPEKEWQFYAEQLNYVAKMYGSAGTFGYETDRGFVYLKFGEPHTIDKRSNEAGALPYEIWSYYETHGRQDVKFLFYQPNAMSNQMLLLHSTENDMMFNPYWKNTLLQNPNDPDNKLKYRVFEYFKN